MITSIVLVSKVCLSVFLNFNIGNEFTLRANDVQVVNEAVHLQQIGFL